MKSQQSLIAWTIFIVILVIIALIALPKYDSVAKQIYTAKARNLASGLTAETAVNYTQKKYASKGVVIDNCKDVVSIAGGYLPPGYQIIDKELQSEMISSCILTGPGMEEIQFSEIGIN